MLLIPLRNRKKELVSVAIIDSSDRQLAERRWRLMGDGYVSRSVWLGDGKTKLLLLHREVMQAPSDLEVDHFNGNRVDCRRCNLRLVTHAQQMQNYPSTKGSSSRYRGVTWHAGCRKWQVYVQGKYLGLYKDEDEAGRIASEYRLATMPFSNEARAAA